MLEISTSGLMSGDGKRSKPFRAQPPRPSSTLPKSPSTKAAAKEWIAQPTSLAPQSTIKTGEPPLMLSIRALSRFFASVIRTFFIKLEQPLYLAIQVIRVQR
jgi:hypothetical protein